MKHQADIFELIIYLGGIVGFFYCLWLVYIVSIRRTINENNVHSTQKEQKHNSENDLFTRWLILYFSKESFKDFTEEDITNFFLENYEHIITQCPHVLKRDALPLEKVHEHRKSQKECVYAYSKPSI